MARFLASMAVVVFVALAVPGRVAVAQGTLSISGTVWDDQNADGIRQSGEPPAPFTVIVELGKVVDGEAVFQDANGRPFFDDGAGHFNRTDDSGNYVFRNLSAGSYVVKLDGFPSRLFFLTYPARRGSGDYDVAVTLTDRNLTAVDFGLHRPTGVLVIHGIAWANGEIADTETLRAFIDGVDCTAPGGILPTDQLPGKFLLGIAPASLIPGCGAPGKVVRFTVEGLPANETVVWPTSVEPNAPDRGRTTRIEMDIIAGPPFAYFVGVLVGADGGQVGFNTSDFRVLVDGHDCGRVGGGVFLAALVVIPSAEMVPGCGYEGAMITFTIRGVQAGPTVTWHAGKLDIEEIVLPESLRPTDLRPPSVGEAGLK